MKRLRILAPTPRALTLAKRIVESGHVEADIWQRPGSLTGELKSSIEAQIPTLAICALGIVSRTLATCTLPAKQDTAPLICTTESGGSIIPVLGGHRGANDLSQTLARLLSGRAIITTASDQAFDTALDTPPAGWGVHDPQRLFSKFMQNLLEAGEANLGGAPEWLKESSIPHNPKARLSISWQIGTLSGGTSETDLVYVPQGRLVVGLGCERNCPPDFVRELIGQAEQNLGVSLRGAAYASIDLKTDEAAFMEIAPHMRFFPARILSAVEVPNPSDVVRAEVGTPSVSEASALSLAGPGSKLILPKIKNTKATLAVALALEPIDMNIGTPRPALAIVGLGPGATDLVSPQALQALASADTWVGYSLYMDQAAGILGEEKPRLDFNLGDEEARCRAALDEAANGKRVTLICSGDPQVYAMAQVVYELLARHADNEAWQRLHIETLPGITAMSALAAKVGAPMGHDFCAISLSDLNTPWGVIEKKVTAAAAADFVIGFYNPRSKKRDWQLPRALEILRGHRPADCPVVFGRNVSRLDEVISRTTLADLNPEDIDMFTCLIVGASFSQRHISKTGDFIFTPRGYTLS